MSSAGAIAAASGIALNLTAAQDAHPQHRAQTPPARRAAPGRFTHKAGQRFIAAAGKLSLQAQSDEMEMIAAKLLRLASSNRSCF